MKIRFSLKILLTLIFLLFLVNIIEIKDLSGIYKEAKPGFMLGAVLLLPANIFIQWLKWHILAVSTEQTIDKRTTYRSLMIGLYLGLLTPGRMGDFGRAFFIEGENRNRLIGHNIIDKLYSQSLVFFLGLPLLIFYFYSTIKNDILLSSLAGILIVLLSGLFLVFLISPGRLYKIITKIINLFVHSFSVNEILSTLNRLKGRQKINLLFLNILFQIIYVLQFFLLVNAFDELKFSYALVTIPLVVFINTFVPLFFGNLGLREGAAMFLLAKYNVAQASAFNAGIMLFIINLMIPAIMGYIYFASYKSRSVEVND